MTENENIEEEIREVYRCYFHDVYSFIATFTNDRNDIEDLTQEVFIRLFTSLSTFRRKSQLKTWLFSIARNVTIDHIRKQKRKHLFQDYLGKFPLSKEKTTEDIVEAKEEASGLYAALHQLKYDYRMVVLLRGIHEFSIKETAKIMKWKESKVKVTYHRALKILKKDLEGEVDVKERWI
ncbi:RNA polymerase sigma factor [Alkalihalobacillus sp. MEB130]|uniref:RNA polymerase sigma factor n=1 Tax=Alkalihalobacillus sp. MEB130 TaxID=2976704 RepID=UPI0028DFA481|nr:RNA polymerase sigma factor [Alkalihalobacillus sp. MEB130]MDT8861039.1 RNA polymerase sigma factor [Alkalihalobacillus sp. MEB130]